MGNHVVSVVIPVEGSPPTLGECLESVLRQDHPRKEIIIVCRPGGRPRGALPEGSEDVRIIRQDEPCSGARLVNDGMRAARGHIKVLLRPDCVPLGRGWLRGMTEPFGDEGVGAVVSRFASRQGEEPGVGTRLLESVWARQGPPGAERKHVSHACDAYRASLLADVGYFREEIPSPGEALELSLRVKEAGYSVVTSRGAVVRCPTRTGRTALLALARAFGFGRADARLHRQYEVRWLNAGVFSAALFSLALLPLAFVNLPLALVGSGLVFVWAWLLPLRVPLLGWEVPTAVLSFGLWVGLVVLVRDGWSPGLFGKQIHPAILRQWLWLAALVGSFGLLLLRAAGACACRVVRQPGGWLYAVPAGLLALAWWPLAGLGHIYGLIVDSLLRR